MENIGHNNPPTQFELHKGKIEALVETARGFLDGDPINSDDLAETISKLDRSLQKAWKDADDDRAAEVKPFNDQVKEINAGYNKDLKPQVERARKGCQDMIGNWLKKKEAERLAEAERLRKEAEAEAAKQAEMLAQRDSTNLESVEAFEEQVEKTKRVEAQAHRVETNHTTINSGGVGRAMSLRKHWKAELVDVMAAMDYLWPHYEERFLAIARQIAAEEVQRGKREIPGFKITCKEVAR